MESLIEDKGNFNDKVIGSIVRIKISGSEQKPDVHRLVQVVGNILKLISFMVQLFKIFFFKTYIELLTVLHTFTNFAQIMACNSGTSKVIQPYKVGDRTTDIMLEVLNLDKKEAVSIDSVSNQGFTEVNNVTMN